MKRRSEGHAAPGFCKRVLVLDHGRLIDDFRPQAA